MWLFAWFLIHVAAMVTGSTLSDVNNLYTRLIQNHNRKVRPGDDQPMPTLVNVTFNLVAIQEFDEVNGKFLVIGFFVVRLENDLESFGI